MNLARSALAVSLVLASMSAFAADNPRFEVSVSGFAPTQDISLGADVSVSDGTTSEPFVGSSSVSSSAKGGQFEAIYRPTQRQRIDAQFYTIEDDRNYPFDVARTDVFVDPDTSESITTTATAEGSATLRTRFDLYRVGYGYDFVQSDRLTLTGLVGVYGARLELRGTTQGEATLTDGDTIQTQDLAASGRITRRAAAPGIGLSGEYQINDKWSVRGRAQGFRTQWGNFDNDGRFFNAQASLNYQATDHLTVFAGYDWFDLRLEDDVNQATTVDGVDYTVDGKINGRLRVHGPTLGARYAF